MKLDNRGWGYRDMIIYSSIIIICLIMVVFFSHLMHNQLEKNSSSSNQVKTENQPDVSISLTKEQLFYYHTKEQDIQNATYAYLKKNGYQGVSSIRKIDLDILEGFGYVNNVTDILDGSLCEGYGEIVFNDSSYSINPYIKCSHYVTSGYGE